MADRVTAAVEKEGGVLALLAGWVHYCPHHSFDCVSFVELHFQVDAALLSQFPDPELEEEPTSLNSHLTTENHLHVLSTGTRD